MNVGHAQHERYQQGEVVGRHQPNCPADIESAEHFARRPCSNLNSKFRVMEATKGEEQLDPQRSRFEGKRVLTHGPPKCSTPTRTIAMAAGHPVAVDNLGP